MTAATEDLAVVRRAGRIVAVQASAALAVVLVLVGAVVAGAYLRSQTRQIDAELTTVAMNADDVDDPPPGVELALRGDDGAVSASDGGSPGIALLDGPAGFTDLDDRDRRYRVLTVDRPEGRVVAMLDLAPYRDSRLRLFAALAAAELAGILASVVVVVLFTRRAVRPLAQALALQRRFVADASHELRTPLTVVHTRAQLLAAKLAASGPEVAARDAEAIVADTRVLGGVVDDLLASATFAAGRPDGDRVDMAALCRSVCASMTPYAEAAGVRLVCSAPDSVTAVVGSETGLRRALTALIDNAVGHDGRTVTVSVSRQGQNVAVAVADQGAGIDEATMATLFDRFARGPARANRPSYGIGLALVREIVRGHGGEVSVVSRLGQGATFTLTLPAAGNL